jgi:hypothetical protein
VQSAAAEGSGRTDDTTVRPDTRYQWMLSTLCPARRSPFHSPADVDADLSKDHLRDLN